MVGVVFWKTFLRVFLLLLFWEDFIVSVFLIKAGITAAELSQSAPSGVTSRWPLHAAQTFFGGG